MEQTGRTRRPTRNTSSSWSSVGFLSEFRSSLEDWIDFTVAKSRRKSRVIGDGDEDGQEQRHYKHTSAMHRSHRRRSSRCRCCSF
ncbi:hypothetical protein QLX08_006408 [Tetragonisca angustula]|uniref:Uncharacterized protein n=1 Tax=Tetragonisca angustula TaxID=166442 RepID=A0AAW0ZTZ9_9HYME